MVSRDVFLLIFNGHLYLMFYFSTTVSVPTVLSISKANTVTKRKTLSVLCGFSQTILNNINFVVQPQVLIISPSFWEFIFFRASSGMMDCFNNEIHRSHWPPLLWGRGHESELYWIQFCRFGAEFIKNVPRIENWINLIFNIIQF